jgi:hypothetical protein
LRVVAPLIVRRYNAFVNDDEQPQPSAEVLESIGRIFVQHRVEDVFGLHLIHKHFEKPGKTVMLGTKHESLANGFWTRPAYFDELPESVHGHIFAVSSEDFVAYEYREGEIPIKAAMVGPSFYDEVYKCLVQNDVTHLLGLQVLSPSDIADQGMEFALAGATVIMPKSKVNGDVYRMTGWTFHRNTDGTTSIKGNETHASVKGGPHTKFTDGKWLTSIEDVVSVLRAGNVF